MNFWDNISVFYDFFQRFNAPVYREMKILTQKLTLPYAKVLDCAAGTGELSIAASEDAEFVVCADSSGKMLDIARKKAEKYGAPNIFFKKADILDLPFRDNSFDVVIAGNVLHLLDDPDKAVDEMLRVAKPNGRLLLPTFMTGETGSLEIKLYKLIGFSPAREYTFEEYMKLLKDHGKAAAKMINGKIPCCFAVMKK